MGVLTGVGGGILCERTGITSYHVTPFKSYPSSKFTSCRLARKFGSHQNISQILGSRISNHWWLGHDFCEVWIDL